MKKLFLLFALVLTVCSTAMAEALFLESEVGTIGTLAGREAMVVDLGGTIGKVAVAMENVDATTDNPYGTHFSTVSGADHFYDPQIYKLEGGWYVPSEDELTALKGLLSWKSDYSAVYYKGHSDLQFPLRASGQSFYGDYITSTTSVNETYTDYAYLYIAYAYNKGEGFGIPSTAINKGHNLSKLAIRPFHKLPAKDHCLFYTSSDGNVIIPSEDMYSSIESNTYENGKGIITFKEELTSIEERAFYHCTTLTSVTIPAPVVSIKASAFSGCSNLTTLTFTANSQLKTIGENAFDGTALSGDLSCLPASLTSIGMSAFGSCTGLTTLNFAADSQLETIGKSAFRNTGISGELTLPASLKSIEEYAFNELAITAVTIPASLKSIEASAFNACESLATLTFAEGSQLDTIGKSAFAGTAINGELTFPASLKSIGAYAFNGCSGLTTLTFAEGSQLEFIGTSAFSKISITGDLTLPASVKSMEASIFSGCQQFYVYMSAEDLSNISNKSFESSGAVIMVPAKLYEAYKKHFGAYNQVYMTSLSDWQEYTIAKIEKAIETVNTLSETDKTTIATHISTIGNATDFDEAATAYYAALAIIDRQKEFETKVKETFGALGTRHEGPAIRVTGNDGETIILFNLNKVEFVDMEALGQGKANANGIGKVKWIQLWKDGPKFAEYNVGAKSTTEYGGFYCWGNTNDESIKSTGIYKEGLESLTGDTDTATKLWGDNWRMPTGEEFEALANPDNCDSGWTTVDGVEGYKFTGKGDYKGNSIFLPTAGFYFKGIKFNKTGGYWASTLIDGRSTVAQDLYFNTTKTTVQLSHRSYGYTIRAVLNETK